MSKGGRRGRPWTAEEVTEMIQHVCAGAGVAEIADAHGRTVGAVEAALYRLIDRDRLSARRSLAWEVLCRDLASADVDRDWWTLYCSPGRGDRAFCAHRSQHQPARRNPDV
jgi:hypothetical protein